jgi:UBX domain-containing protein 1
LVRANKNRGGEEAKGSEPKNNLKITLYSNGFVIDDGQFRPYDGPENQAFMKELNEGYVPREL